MCKTLKPERYYFPLSCLCAGNQPQDVLPGERNEICFLPTCGGEVLWERILSYDTNTPGWKTEQGDTMQFYLNDAPTFPQQPL